MGDSTRCILQTPAIQCHASTPNSYHAQVYTASGPYHAMSLVHTMPCHLIFLASVKDGAAKEFLSGSRNLWHYLSRISGHLAAPGVMNPLSLTCYSFLTILGMHKLLLGIHPWDLMSLIQAPSRIDPIISSLLSSSQTLYTTSIIKTYFRCPESDYLKGIPIHNIIHPYG